ncbi:MAG TPA: PDZ domain-containing protein [Blastocatellia bacterium]|nr:PDZ domain-containing protein [Blastocatellia bacterium]
MVKRYYLVISLVAALGLSIGYVEVAAGQKDKQKDKSDLKEKGKTGVDSTVFSFPLNMGEGAYLGVYLEEVTPDRAKELGLREERGAVVMKIVEGGPADKAGVKENDVIVSFNGRRVDSVRELQRLLSETPAGRTVSVEIVRGGNLQTFSATLSKRTSELFLLRPDGSLDSHKWGLFDRHLEQQFKKGLPDFGTFNFSFPRSFGTFRGTRLGVTVETLGDQLAEYFGVKGRQGLLVTEVIENTPASRAGLKAGDVIVAVDNTPVESLNTLVKALDNKDEGPINLSIVRNRAEQTITVTLEKRETRPATRRRVTTVSTDTGVV